MPEINYCQNLWTQFAKVTRAHRFANDSLRVANTSGEINTFRESLAALDSELAAMKEFWDGSFVILPDGRKLFGPDYEAIKELESIIGHPLLERDSIFDGDAIQNGNIVKLILPGTNIKDVTVVGRLHALRELDLTQTPVKDLAPLNNLVNLQKLSLGAGWEEGAIDISPLEGLVNLQDLGIYRETPVLDISVMASLTGLRAIRFNYKKEHDFNAIMNLPNLIGLHLGRCSFGRPDPNQIEELRGRGVHVWFD